MEQPKLFKPNSADLKRVGNIIAEQLPTDKAVRMSNKKSIKGKRKKGIFKQ